jgi:type IV pilus assembly protein PilC
MNLHDLMHLDLGALLRGKVEVGPPSQLWPRRPLLGRVANVLLLPLRLVGDILLWRRPLRIVTEQLARIVACNAPLVPALDATLVDLPYRRARRSLHRLRGALAAGNTLSDAMKRQPYFFPRYYIDLVRAGEDTGTLSATLKNLIGLLTESDRLRRAFVLPLSYLATLLVFTGMMTTFLCVKVFPVFGQILNDFGSSPLIGMPRPLQMFIRFGDRFLALTRWAGFSPALTAAALIAIAVMLLVFWLMWRGGFIRLAASHVALGIPLVRRLVIKSNLGRAARIMEVLLKAGSPVDEALDTTATTSILSVFKSVLERLRDRVRRGESLSAACEQESRLLPPSFRGMVSLGESSGLLPDSLGRIADHYEREVITAGMVASRFILPAVVLLMASWVLMLYSYQFMMMTTLVDSMIP